MAIKNEDRLANVDIIEDTFESLHYICNEQIATAVFLAYHLENTILYEGPS